MTNTVPLLTEAEPVLWMVVGKDGAREAECTYEESADFVRCWDHNHPNNAPHRAVPLYTHAQPIKLTEAQARSAFLKKWNTRPGAPFAGDTNMVRAEAWWLSALHHVGVISKEDK